jgi:hypothetical protein
MSSGSNLPSVTVEDFTRVIEMQFNEKNFRPVFGLGKGGIGKTESIADLAINKLKIGYIDIRLLMYGETDLKGIPYPNQEHTKTIWLQNDILPNEERDGDKGILVLDEITSCSRSVRTAAYQLLNERKLGEYVLPQGWMIVCLGNGEEDGGDFQGMEGNFANRCSVFNVVPNLEAWKKWAFKNNINPLVSGYVSFKPADLHTYDPDNETEILFASPRSWTAVSDILNKYGYDDQDVILNSRIIANVGQRVGQQFTAFCKYKKQAVDPNDIVKKGEMPKLENQEIIFITIQSIVKILGDMISDDINKLGDCQETTIQWSANGLRWLLSLRTEYAVMGFRDLISYDEGIKKLMQDQRFHTACPELVQFAHNNIEVFK